MSDANTPQDTPPEPADTDPIEDLQGEPQAPTQVAAKVNQAVGVLGGGVLAAGLLVVLVGGTLSSTAGATCSTRLTWEQRQAEIDQAIREAEASEAADASRDTPEVDTSPDNPEADTP